MTTYDSILARSFSRHEQKKLGCGAFFGCFIIALCICTIFKPYLSPLPVVNLKLSMGFGYKMLMITEETNQPQNLRTFTNQSSSTQDVKIQQKYKIICNISEPRSDFCEMDGDIRIDGNSSTIFIMPSSNQTNIHFIANNSWTIKPYARKGDEGAMQSVRPFKFNSQEIVPQYYCTQNHSVPAIVFSTGGYTGNNFHDFSDVVIPLYLTSRKFNGQVQFLIADKNIWWTTKFRKVLDNLSKYEVIDLDRENKVHCFSSMILGLKKHKELNIDPLKSPQYSMKDFRGFLRSSYGLKRETAIKLSGNEKRRPRLLIISRKWSRAFLNERKIVKMAKRLRFDVVLTEATSNLSQFSQVVNSCDVMMGVHGAGLTNLVFLPNNAVFIQVVPFGGLEWLATTDFGNPSKDMNLRYLEYRISEGESSLIQQYPLDHDVFKDPYSIQRKGWEAFKSVYLDKQNVMLDVGRFRATLLEALKLLRM